MQFTRFKNLILIFIIFSNNAFALERFSSKTCLEKFFKTKITSVGPLFGLFPHEMMIDKKHCLISVHHKKYLSKEWKIDVCREPVHMKISSATGGVDVAKKEQPCMKPDKSKDTSDFCAQYFELFDIIQDDGLIFAEGDRDNIDTDHGKTYCTYLLLKRYLNDSIVFSRYTPVDNLFTDTKAIEVTPVPVVPTEPTTETPVP